MSKPNETKVQDDPTAKLSEFIDAAKTVLNYLIADDETEACVILAGEVGGPADEEKVIRSLAKVRQDLAPKHWAVAFLKDFSQEIAEALAAAAEEKTIDADTIAPIAQAAIITKLNVALAPLKKPTKDWPCA